MISQCLESGVIFQIPISWPMSTRTSCARYRYKHDPSTIHKEQVHTYTSRLKVLHIDSRVAHELEVIMTSRGPGSLVKAMMFPDKRHGGDIPVHRHFILTGFGKVSTRQDEPHPPLISSSPSPAPPPRTIHKGLEVHLLSSF